MATHTASRSTRPAGTPLRTFGLLGLTIGLAGFLVWAGTALFASGNGTVGEDSIVFDVAEIGAEDPVARPGVWTGKNESGQVVWEGRQEEWQTITTRDRASYQSHLRARWLYPSVAIAAIGLCMYLLAERRHPAATRSSTAR